MKNEMMKKKAMSRNAVIGIIVAALLLLVAAYFFLPSLSNPSGNVISSPEEVSVGVPATDISPGISPVFIWVSSIKPLNLTKSQSVMNNITVTFSEAMNPETLNENTFILIGPKNEKMKGVITSDSTGKIWTFNPAKVLSFNSVYNVIIAKDVKGISSNSLEKDFAWNFMTSYNPGSPDGGSSASTPASAPAETLVLRKITLTPISATLNNGSTQQMNATGLDQNNHSIAATITYTSSNETVATVNSTGFVIALVAGNTTINASSGGISNTSTIFVVDVGADCPSVSAVVLGLSSSYVIIAKTAISDTNPTLSSIIGDIAIDPAAGSLITDLSCANVTGTIYDNNAGYTGGWSSNKSCLITNATETLAAESAMETAYLSAKSALDYPACVTELGDGNIGGLTLAPGVYKWSTGVTIPTDVTLDCGGNTNAVFVFQIAQTLGISNGIDVILTGGCQTKNIFWQANTAATLGTTSVFNGNIFTGTAITLNSGARLNGRAFAQSAVTLGGSPVTIPI
jgi:hypothetical protein